MFTARNNFLYNNINNLQIFGELLQTGTSMKHNAHNYTASSRIHLNIIYGSRPKRNILLLMTFITTPDRFRERIFMQLQQSIVVTARTVNYYTDRKGVKRKICKICNLKHRIIIVRLLDRASM